MPIGVSELIARARSAVRCVSASEAAELLQRDSRLLLLDVREPAEHAKEAIPGSTLVPRGLLEMKVTELCPEDDRPILVHCGAGGRAVLAAHTLQEMGYTQVRAIDADFSDLAEAAAAADPSRETETR